MEDELNLVGVTETVVETLRAEFPEFKTVIAEDEREERGDKVDVPALLVQLTELEPNPDSDGSDGKWPCLVHFEARIVYGFRTPKVRRQTAASAGSIAAFVHNNRLGVGWGGAQVLACAPDEFAPKAEQYDIWQIEWAHKADLGKSALPPHEDLPAHVYLGHAPEIGPEHEGNYEEVGE